MKRSPIWDTLEHAPILDLIAVPHVHKRAARGRCTNVNTLAVGAAIRGMRLHVFHDDQNRLYVVKLPGA